MLKITKPFEIISQPFGGNAITMYKDALKLNGHPGIDFKAPYGAPIPCVADNSYCYAVLSKDNPNLMAYRAVCTIVEDGDKCYEIIYGHCSEIDAVPGITYRTGEMLAKVGNTGSVFDGGVEVSQALKVSGSHAGSHLHLQVRLLTKVPANEPVVAGEHTLNDGVGLYIRDGYKYKVINWDNGYNGCIDPAQFFVQQQCKFNKPLCVGKTDPDILELQKFLGVQPQTGYFGLKTLAAVKNFQKSHNLPCTGYVGNLTLTCLNNHG